MDLTFDDFEEIKEHPVAGELLQSLDQLTTDMLQKSVADIRNFKEDLHGDIDQANFNKFIN